MEKPEMIEMLFLSETTFSRGEETPGIVDVEIEHDEFGCPRVSGKTVHGLLRDTWLSLKNVFPEFNNSGKRLFGLPGEMNDSSILRISNFHIDTKTRDWIKYSTNRKDNPISPNKILEAFTRIRYQTSENAKTRAAKKGSLRSSRVILKGKKLYGRLNWLEEPSNNDLRLLALVLRATRNAGWSRNRGRGAVKFSFYGTDKPTENFLREVENEL